MINSLDLEAGNKMGARSDQDSVVYGYPVRPAAASHPGHLLGTRTTSSLSSSDTAAAPPVNHWGTSLRDKVLFTIFMGFLLAGIVWCGIGEVMNTHNYPRFEIDSMSFSPPSSRVNETSAANGWTIGVFVRNTNRYTRISYDDFQVSVYYKDEQLSTSMVSPLYLGPKNQTSVVAALQGQSLKTKNLTAAEIDEDRRHGTVKFDVILQVKMTYFFPFPAIGGKKKVWKTELLCLDAQVGFSSNATEQGTMVGGPYRCYSPLDLLIGVLLGSKS